MVMVQSASTSPKRFLEQTEQFLTDELDPLGRRIIELCRSDAPLEEYLAITPMNIR